MANVSEPQHSIEIALNEAEDANGGAYVLLSKMAEAAADAIPDGWVKVDGKWIDLNSKQGFAMLRCWYAEYPELRL